MSSSQFSNFEFMQDLIAGGEFKEAIQEKSCGNSLSVDICSFDARIVIIMQLVVDISITLERSIVVEDMQCQLVAEVS